MGAIGRILGFSILGAAVLPALVLVIMIAVYVTDSRCGTPGDSGGCEMGMATTVLVSAPIGAAIGFIVGIWKSVRRRAS
jgi:hypothetical protein